MGSFLSTQNKDKRRRSNRLSKPPPSQFSVSSQSFQASISNFAASASPGPRQNSCGGGSIPISSPDIKSSSPSSQSLPTISLLPETPWMAIDQTAGLRSSAKETDEMCFRSPTSSSAQSVPLGRRSSFQPTRIRSDSQSFVRPVQPRRCYSIHTSPHRASSTVYKNTIQEAASSNTHFMVDNQGFSLIRRRSLLTRPGVATRRSTRDAARRLPSPIGQEDGFCSYNPTEITKPSQWPLSECEDAFFKKSLHIGQIRPPTPNDYEYTQLGALRLGSLRVVNGSASPCPSDRTLLNQPCTPNVEAGQPQNSTDGCQESASRAIKNKCSTSRLLIPRVSDEKTHAYPSGSPLSFEETPTIQGFPRHDPTDDEGINIFDDERSSAPSPEKFSQIDTRSGRYSRSHRKVDSGYSSAASVRSLQENRASAPTDSEGSSNGPAAILQNFTLDSISKDQDLCSLKDTQASRNKLPIHRHPSLQGLKSRSSPDISGWSMNLSMSHENSKSVVERRKRSTSFTVSAGSNYRPESLPRYCAQMLHFTPKSIHTTGTELRHEAQKELTFQHEPLIKSYFDLPNIMSDHTINHRPLSVGSGQGEGCSEDLTAVHGSLNLNFVCEAPRGRTRSRGMEYQRRSLIEHNMRSSP